MAVAFVVILLVLATTSQGAFTVSRWAPLALFALAVLLGGLVARGSARLASRPLLIAVCGIWGLAAWAMLSMLWAQSPGSAFAAGNRWILYAAIATLPLALPVPRRSLAAAGWAVTVGIGVLALYVLFRLLIDGSSLFLAGRLNGPVNYRNATALLFALPFWPLVIAMASRTYPRSVRASAFAIATLCVGLAFLTQSRGIVIGLVVGALLALSAGPDRVRRAWVAALSIAGVAAASPLLLRPYHQFDGGAGIVTAHGIKVAAEALAVLTLAALVVGLLLAVFDTGLRANSPQMRHVRQVARLALAAGVVVAIAGALAAIGNPVTYARHKWDDFRNLNASTTTSSTRLLSTGGQRYDLWRVAIKELESAPILGVGADNYSFDYYRWRRTNRNLDDPHSLVFGLLSENGIVGSVLFAVFVGGVVMTLRRGWKTMADGDKRNAIAPATAGAVLLGQSTVDWIWLIPGLTAVGLFALSVAAAQAASGAEAPAHDPALTPASPGPPAVRAAASRRWPAYRLLRPVLVLGVLASIVSVLALFLSDAYVQRARTLETNPRAELSAAQTAGSFDPWSVTPHYLQASAYESMGERGRAFQQLHDALSMEPRNFATLGVIGDFEARGGNFALARRFYRRALALNPLDIGLRQLVHLGQRLPTRAAKRG